METQDYLLVSKPSADELIHGSSNEQLMARRDRLGALGFESLRHVETKIAPKLEMASMLWPEMTAADLRLWGKFLPTRRSIQGFTYDSIPDEALDAIELAQQAGCFDEIVIWTPEGNGMKGRLERAMNATLAKIEVLTRSIDPMAVGIVTDFTGEKRYYSIVRWGEALLPVKKIARRVSRVDWQLRILLRIIPAILLVVGIGFYAAGIVTFGIASMVIWTIISIVILAVLAVILAVSAAD